MLNKINKIVVLTLIVFTIFTACMPYISKADSVAKGLITDLDAGEDSDANTSVNNVVSTVITIVRIVGVAVAIVMLLVIAMKYMTAAPGEKADIKKSAVVYVVGAVVLFAVTGILGIINSFSSKIKT